MNVEKIYAQQIKQRYPDLSIETVHLNQDGQYNDVLVVNNTLIFRFAKYATGIETLRQETTILSRIQEDITLDIPQPIYQHLDTQTVGEAFMGYRMIPGEPLWYKDFCLIDEVGILEAMAGQLAIFLRELHHIPVDQVIPLELPVADQFDEWTEMYSRIQTRLFPYMRTEARDQVRQHFKTFLNNPQLYEFTPALRHGDFGTGNILYDPKTYAITGIIDFGFAGLGDPAIDFAGLAGLGESFFRRCCTIYPQIEQTMARIHFYRGTFALQEAIFGLENNDPEAFASGMTGYI